MKVPFLDLAHQYDPVEPQILEVWHQILKTRQFVAGPHVSGFERRFAEAHDVAEAIAVSSGTTALELIMRGLDLRPGDRVAVPANTFIATAEAVSNAGGVPYFIDCDPETSNIDPGGIPKAIRDGIVGIIGVHLYGRPFDFDAISSLVAGTGVWVVEDAAQAHLATYKGLFVGGLGIAAGFSFYPGKNLGAPAEGGAVTTNSTSLAHRLRMLRDHGQVEKYRSEVVGTNARMSELVASALELKLPYLEDWNQARRQVAGWYRERLADHPKIGVPPRLSSVEPVHHLYVVEVPNRDAIKTALEAAGVGVGLHYPIPIHLQTAYVDLGYRAGDFPVSEAKAGSIISLPMFPTLTVSQVDYVCRVLVEAVSGVAAV